MMQFIHIKKWEKYQRNLRKNNRRSWIVLDTGILDKYSFTILDTNAQLLYIKLLLLRGRLDEGIPYDIEYIHSHASLPKALNGEVLEASIQTLIQGEFIFLDSAVKWGSQDRTGQDRTGQDSAGRVYKKPEYTEDFLAWWKIYPRKDSKADALKAWHQTEEGRPPQAEMLKATQAMADFHRAAGTPSKFVKLPAGWLRTNRWEDELAADDTEVALVEANRRDILYQIDFGNYQNEPLWAEYNRDFHRDHNCGTFVEWLALNGQSATNE